MNPMKRDKKEKKDAPAQQPELAIEQDAPDSPENENSPQQEGDEASFTPDDIKKLESDLMEAVRQREEYLTLAQRVQADFENYRRRNKAATAESFDEGARAFATTLLPVIDNLERAVEAAEKSPDTALLSGVQMVYRQLIEAFQKRGIEAINRQGEPFDPALENAVMQGTAEEGEPGTVCQVLQKGYKMDKFVLRHAMVKVVAQ